LAKRTAVGLNEIRKLINVEHKFVDVNDTSASTRNGTVTLLSPIAQGDNISEREGDSIKVQSLELYGGVFRDPASTSNEGVRVLIVRDLQNAGAAPTAADILQAVGTAYAPYQAIDFLNGSDLNKRFTIVYDELTFVDTYHPTQMLSMKTNHDCHVFFRGTGSTVASSGNGTYFLVVVSDAATNSANFYFSSRLRFTDN
jgi:hypothetical protein